MNKKSLNINIKLVKIKWIFTWLAPFCGKVRAQPRIHFALKSSYQGNLFWLYSFLILLINICDQAGSLVGTSQSGKLGNADQGNNLENLTWKYWLRFSNLVTKF